MRNTKTACIVGHYGFGKTLLNGQTVKTKTVTEELERQCGKDQIIKIDTHGGVKALLNLPLKLWKALKQCRNVVIFPAHKGVRVIAPLLVLENIVFKRKLHYVVIGGWLPALVNRKPILRWALMRFDAVYVETTSMENKMKGIGFNNITIMPNCKKLSVAEKVEMSAGVPHRLCTFSRVMKEKGIEVAVKAVSAANRALGRCVFTLDIYGQIDNNERRWFEELESGFPEFIRYKGCVPYDESTATLCDYYALLFPTKFFTEGIPGTIIDAYAAGIPVIASRWENYSDCINDNVTGIGYPFGDDSELEQILIQMARNPYDAIRMRNNCIQRAREYLPENTVMVMKLG